MIWQALVEMYETAIRDRDAAEARHGVDSRQYRQCDETFHSVLTEREEALRDRMADNNTEAVGIGNRVVVVTARTAFTT